VSPPSSKQGLLLVNLGTPEAPNPEALRRYLGQFLMDRHVLDLPFVLRWLLVHGVILGLRRRPAFSAEAYGRVWTAQGSPLACHHRALVGRVSGRLGAAWAVAGGMRYGKPSIEDAFSLLLQAGVSELRVLPLYPQYSEAATGSAIEEARRVARRLAPALPLRFVELFSGAGHEAFLDAFSLRVRSALEGFEFERLLFSFHGLPERSPGAAAYRAQCERTAKGLASSLGLPANRWELAFQSRLGRGRWLLPDTHERCRALARAGVRRLAVACPSFVADCVETLEEIGLRARDAFVAAGGGELRLVPSLNDSEDWVVALERVLT
jgi:protoporphyrin/coproporphyrin ferrochelatase